jgi:hypothetical protein
LDKLEFSGQADQREINRRTSGTAGCKTEAAGLVIDSLNTNISTAQRVSLGKRERRGVLPHENLDQMVPLKQGEYKILKSLPGLFSVM